MHEIIIHIIEALLAKLIAWQVERVYETLKDKSRCAVCKYSKNLIRAKNHQKRCDDKETALCYECTVDFAHLLNRSIEKLPRILKQQS